LLTVAVAEIAVATPAVDTLGLHPGNTTRECSPREIIKLFCEDWVRRIRVCADLLGNSPFRLIDAKKIIAESPVPALEPALDSVARETVVAAD